MRSIMVNKNEAGQRLDKLLAKYLMIHEKIEKDDFETLMQGKMDPSQFEELPEKPAETAETEPAENGDAAPAEDTSKPSEGGDAPQENQA